MKSSIKKKCIRMHTYIYTYTLVLRSHPIEYESMMYALFCSKLMSTKENWQGSKKKRTKEKKNVLIILFFITAFSVM
jgi:hypothetical protein